MLFAPLNICVYSPTHTPNRPSRGGESCTSSSKIFKRKTLVEVRYNPTHPIKQRTACNTFQGLKGIGRLWNCLFIFTNLTFNHLHSLSTFLRQSQWYLKLCSSLLKYTSNIKPFSVKLSMAWHLRSCMAIIYSNLRWHPAAILVGQISSFLPKTAWLTWLQQNLFGSSCFCKALIVPNYIMHELHNHS